ncbi:unnamed protein product [Phytophthora fragariaefolia]|uniref:Unnamed protein product n=1 Tax=Phytophthora fragariaefolia TaxID=1490495 RepID=A0A9W6X3V2_9STRA|nr:unnamed protein product [Phytophthora fragariaefolia]
MASPVTTERQDRVRQIHLDHRQVVEDLLAFYCEHNVLYEDVAVDCSDLAPEMVSEQLNHEEIDANIEANDVDTESNRVTRTAELGDADTEMNVFEHRVGRLVKHHVPRSVLPGRLSLPVIIVRP